MAWLLSAAAFAGLWFSHVPVEARLEFLNGLHRHLLPGARVLLVGRNVQALEDAEELVGVAHVEAGTVVAHEILDDIPLELVTDLDHRRLALPRVLDGVEDEVLRDAPGLDRVTLHRQPVRRAIGQMIAEQRGRLFGRLGQTLPVG